jgi:hypothetical protein
MRLVYDDRELARARGAVAKADIERCYSEKRVGEVIQQRLAQVYAQRPAAGNESLAAWAAGPPISNVPAVPSMDLGRSSHGPLGVLMKHGMDCLFRYHAHYQGEVNLAFAAFMRELEAENRQLRARVDALTTRLENLTRERQRD